MTSIAIIGVGNIGFRHLEGITKSEIIEEIFIYEPNYSAIEKIKESKFFNSSIKICETISELPEILDFCIVATDSRNRLKAILSLVSKVKQIKYIILEKVLVQSFKSLKQLEFLLEKYDAKIFVNQWFSRWLIKNNIFNSNEYIINMDVSGIEWGIACNAVHFINAFRNFTKSNNLKKDSDCLFRKPFKTKRDGYFDVNGFIHIQSKCLSNLNLVSFEKSKTYKKGLIKLKLFTNKSLINIDLLRDRIIVENQLDSITKTKKLPPYLISEDIKNIIYDISNNFDSGLPSLKRSIDEHKVLFFALSCVEGWDDYNYSFPIT